MSDGIRPVIISIEWRRTARVFIVSAAGRKHRHSIPSYRYARDAASKTAVQSGACVFVIGVCDDDFVVLFSVRKVAIQFVRRAAEAQLPRVMSRLANCKFEESAKSLQSTATMRIINQYNLNVKDCACVRRSHRYNSIVWLDRCPCK